MGWGVCLHIEIMILLKVKCEDENKISFLILYKEQTLRYGCICVLKS